MSGSSENSRHFPSSPYNYGPAEWGAESLNEAFHNWLAYTSRPLEDFMVWAALDDMKRLSLINGCWLPDDVLARGKSLLWRFPRHTERGDMIMWY
jgi:hypothetical protein